MKVGDRNNWNNSTVVEVTRVDNLEELRTYLNDLAATRGYQDHPLYTVYPEGAEYFEIAIHQQILSDGSTAINTSILVADAA